MFAVIKTGGKQYKVIKDAVLEIERLEGKEGDNIDFAEVLMIFDGKDIQIGTPFLSGVKVKAKILEQKRGKKVIVFKYKAKKRYRKTQGHRQNLTKIQITDLGISNKQLATSNKVAKATKEKVVAKKPAKKTAAIKK